MEAPQLSPAPSENKVIHYSLQLLALAALIGWCFVIIRPFLTPLIWGSVMAVALYPTHKLLTSKLRGRNIWSATIITVLFLILIIGPCFWLLISTVSEVKNLIEEYRAGNITVPSPSADVKTWPLVGSKLFEIWSMASSNFSSLIMEHKDQVKNFILGFLALLAGTGKGMLLFTLSVVVSGVFLAKAKTLGEFVESFFIRIAGYHGKSMTEVAKTTVGNVAKGILGVALIQSLLAGIGLVLAGVPLAGLWILVCVILAIVQIGIIPVSGGVIIYIWTTGDTLTASLLTVWLIVVGLMDNVLKPILLGRGAPVPMFIVFIGAIGGFMASGFIGLFTGAIILSLGYKLFNAWLAKESV